MSLNKTLLAILLSVALSSCAGLTSQKQKIGAACSSVASGAQAVAAAVTAGRVSKVDGRKAAVLYHSTDSFCEPVPAESLLPADYAKLVTAALSLTAQAAASGAK